MTAGSAAEVVVMLVNAASPVERFAGVRADHVDESLFGHLSKLGVHGGEAHLLALCAQGGVKVLGRDEPLALIEHRLDRAALPSHSLGDNLWIWHLQIVTVLILLYHYLKRE